MDVLKPAPKPITVADFFLEEVGRDLGWFTSKCISLSYQISEYLKNLGIPHKLLWLRSMRKDVEFPTYYEYLRPVETWEIMGDTYWRFHVVVEIYGLVHDPWSCLPPVPRAEYLAKLFPAQRVKVFEGNFTRQQLRLQAEDHLYAAP